MCVHNDVGLSYIYLYVSSARFCSNSTYISFEPFSVKCRIFVVFIWLNSSILYPKSLLTLAITGDGIAFTMLREQEIADLPTGKLAYFLYFYRCIFVQNHWRNCCILYTFVSHKILYSQVFCISFGVHTSLHTAWFP